MQLQVGVKILLKNSEGKFLLVRRNPKKYPEVGAKWDIVGGRIEPGTPLLDNLKREIKEEVGMDYQGIPKLVAAQDIFVHRYTPVPLRVRGTADSADSTDIKNGSLKNKIDRHVVRLTYLGNLDGSPVIDSEHTEAKWMTAKEIKGMSGLILDSYFKELLDNQIIKL